MAKKSVSIIIPALREEKRIGKTLKVLARYLEKHLKQFEVEILIVAASSPPDNTAGVVKAHADLFRKYRYKLLEPGPKVGKGRDVQYGMLRAKGEYRIFMDADLATPLYHLESMLNELQDGADIVIGSRDLTTIHAGFRSVLSQAGNLLSKSMVGVYHVDTQCGFKGFTAKAAKICFGKQLIMGWGFDIELLAIAQQYKLKVVDLPIYDWTDVPGGNLNEKVINAALRTFKELYKIRKNIRSGEY